MLSSGLSSEYSLEEIERLIQIIIDSKEFKRLAEKTQIIFTKGPKPNIRNRISHTIEVAEIAEAVAKKNNMSFSEQRLAYLIGLCHDIGHTAFGHDGEARINLACQAYQIYTDTLDEKFYGEKDWAGELTHKKPEYSFEHHSHSVRVFNKILRDNNIELDFRLKSDILQGILCHSTSRTADSEVRKPIWAIVRFADKIYPYTDMADILELGIQVDENILDDINKKKEYIKNEKGAEIPFTEEDKQILKEVLDTLKQKEGLKKCKERYVEESELKPVDAKTKSPEEKAYSYIASNRIQREGKILKVVAKYLRQEKIMKKEELKARAMIDEVFGYIVFNSLKADDVDIIEACFRATMFIAQSTDEEVRQFFKCSVVKDVEWQKSKKERLTQDYSVIQLSANERSKEYPIRLTPREYEEIARDPDSMLQIR